MDPLIRLWKMHRGESFQTALTCRLGVVLDRVPGCDGVQVDLEVLGGSKTVVMQLAPDILVRPVEGGR